MVVGEGERVERVDQCCRFDVCLPAYAGQGEGWLYEGTLYGWTALEALRACIVAELDIGKFAAARLVANIDLMMAECVFPYLVFDLAGELEKRGFEGVGFGAAIN
jgi:hypothetical protein